MRSLILGFGFCFLLLFSFALFGQEPNLDMFYGKKEFKGGSLGYDSLLNTEGGVGSLELYYLTKSKKSEQAEFWPYYYGVSLEFAAATGKDYHFADQGDGDFDAWWALLWIEGKLFYQDTETIRPYFDLAGGLGVGELVAEGEDFEEDWKQIDLARIRAGTGVEIMLNKDYALDLGVCADGSLGMGGGLLENASLAFSGAQVRVGISKWSDKPSGK